MTDEIIVSEPPPTAGETEMLLFALDRSRRQFAWKTGGLDAAGLGRRHPPSVMTLGGLIKHLALVEDHYTATWVTGEPIGAPWDGVDFDADPDWEWRTGATDPPDQLYALWSGAVGRTRKALTSIRPGDLSRPGPNFRRLLVDLHDEYARHVGHADLLREAVDGLTGEDPPR